MNHVLHALLSLLTLGLWLLVWLLTVITVKSKRFIVTVDTFGSVYAKPL